MFSNLHEMLIYPFCEGLLLYFIPFIGDAQHGPLGRVQHGAAVDLPLGTLVLGQVPGQRVPRRRRPRARLLAEVLLLGEIGGGRHGAAGEEGSGEVGTMGLHGRAEDENAAHLHGSPGQEGALLGPLLRAFSLQRCDACRGRATATATSAIWDSRWALPRSPFENTARCGPRHCIRFLGLCQPRLGGAHTFGHLAALIQPIQAPGCWILNVPMF